MSADTPRRPAPSKSDLHTGPGAAGGEPVSRPQPAAGLAARLRRAGAGPGAGRGRTHGAARSASPTRCTPTSCCRGDPSQPIIYDVERTRDGGSFTTRRVKAIQHGRTMFAMSVSFHIDEPGSTTRAAMPRCRLPRSCRAKQSSRPRCWPSCPPTCAATGNGNGPSSCARWTCRAISRARSATPSRCIWMRASGRLPDAFPLHQCVLAYASDFSLLDTALIAHGKLMFDKDVQLASLDHALWLHRPFRADEWLLYAHGQPIQPRCARLLPRQRLHPGRYVGSIRGPGRPDATARFRLRA